MLTRSRVKAVVWSAKQVRKLRRQYKESQPRFARRLGIHVNTIRRWEYGDVEPPAMACILLQRLKEDVDALAIRPWPGHSCG